MKLHFSYNQIHETIRSAAESTPLRDFRPTLMLAIGGGGFIPARILRTFLRKQVGKSIPIQAIGLTLYEHDDIACDPLNRPVRKTQWLMYQHQNGPHEGAVSLQGHRILIVDEVDDTRKTLSYAVDEILKDIAAEKEAWLASHHQQQQQRAGSVGSPATPGMLSPPDSPVHSSDESAASVNSSGGQQQIGCHADAAAEWQEPVIGVFVVHNKLKQKKADLPAAIMDSTYFTGGDIQDHWVIYPWDADDIWEHTEQAHSPTSVTQSISPSPTPTQTTAPAVTPMVC